MENHKVNNKHLRSKFNYNVQNAGILDSLYDE